MQGPWFRTKPGNSKQVLGLPFLGCLAHTARISVATSALPWTTPFPCTPLLKISPIGNDNGDWQVENVMANRLTGLLKCLTPTTHAFVFHIHFLTQKNSSPTHRILGHPWSHRHSTLLSQVSTVCWATGCGESIALLLLAGQELCLKIPL